MGGTSGKDAERNDGHRNAVDPELPLIRALGHPLRAQILSLLEREPMASGQLSQRLEVPVATITHHVRVLHELECIEPIGEEPLRASIETIGLMPA